MNNEFKDELVKLASQVYGTQEEIDAFVAGFEKESADLFGAGMFTSLANNEAVRSAAIKTGFGLAAGLAGAGIVKGITSASGAVSNYKLRQKFEMALAQVISSNRVIKGAKPEKVKEFAETIFKFAPNVASDPNLLASVLSNVILGDSLDPMTIKTLVELEGKYNQNNQSQPLIGIKA